MPRSTRPRSTASSSSAARRGCRWFNRRSGASSAGRRSSTSIPIRSSRSARRVRPKRSPASRVPTACCCSTSSRCRWARDDGRAGRADHRAQQSDPDGEGAGVHDVPGRPDGDGDPRRPGRARAGRRLPLAGALRAARAAAAGGGRGAHPRHVHGRCRRPARRRRARGDDRRRGGGDRSAELRPRRRRGRAHAR